MTRLSYTYIRPPRHFSFEGELLEATAAYLIFQGSLAPSQPLRVNGEEVLAGGYQAVWFLFQGQPWDVARVYRPDGVWTGYYVDMLEPVRWTDADPSTLCPLVDLFLDLWISSNGDARLLDADELEAALASGVISEGQAALARRTQDQLRQEVARGRFPPALVTSFVRER